MNDTLVQFQSCIEMATHWTYYMYVFDGSAKPAWEDGAQVIEICYNLFILRGIDMACYSQFVALHYYPCKKDKGRHTSWMLPR